MSGRRKSTVVKLRAYQTETIFSVACIAIGNVPALRGEVMYRDAVARHRPPAAPRPVRMLRHGHDVVSFVRVVSGDDRHPLIDSADLRFRTAARSGGWGQAIYCASSATSGSPRQRKSRGYSIAGLTVGEVRLALPNFDNIAVGIANVAAGL